MTETTDWSKGAAFVEGAIVPIDEAKISVLDWGFTRSDVTYDVVHVWQGAFFRLDDHLDRFQASMAALRMSIPQDRAAVRAVVTDCVRRSGLRDAYVALVAARGRPQVPGSRKVSDCANHLIAYAVPFIWVFTPEVQARGAHLVIGGAERIAPAAVDPTVKNYHWGDLTRGVQQAQDSEADSAVLLDHEGFVTEGPGFNIFAIIDGAVVSPDRGALEGITRMTVFELCEALGIACRTGRITADELREADEIFTSTTAGGVMPVARIDGRILGNDRPGPLTTRIRDLYWAWHQDGRYATPVDYATPADRDREKIAGAA